MSKDIDIQIVESVMHWERIASDSVLSNAMYRKPGVAHFVWPASIPSYSTDISAAFQVVEKMREDEWNCRIDISAPPSMKTTICEFWTGLGTVKAEAANESLPRAICEAALAAVSLT